jgi:hypothetical protein
MRSSLWEHRCWRRLPDMQGDVLFARLQLASPHARSFLVASPSHEASNRRIAQAVAIAATGAGNKVRLVEIGPSTSNDQDSTLPFEITCVERTALPTPGDLRDYIAKFDGINVISGGGLDTDAVTMIAASVADVTILVIRRGRTRRTEIERVRALVESAGGRTVGSVLLG